MTAEEIRAHAVRSAVKYHKKGYQPSVDAVLQTAEVLAQYIGWNVRP